MGKFISKIALFVMLFIAANFLYLIAVQNLDWNYKKYLESKQLDASKYDILVLGNSLAMDGINTEMIGAAYNLSIGGASLETSLFQLEEYLNSAESKPSTVILGLGSNIDQELKRENLHPIIQYEQGKKFDSFYNLPMLRFKWMATEMLKLLVSRSHRNATLVSGQLRIDRVKVDRSTYPTQTISVLNEDLYNDIESLKSISELCANAGIKLIVIEMPGVKQTQNLIPVGPHLLEGMIFYNLNNQDFCSDFDSESHWLGGSHLNSVGAQFFTRKLIKLVEL